MAGRKISRANMARIQQIADHAHAMGAKLPDPDRTPIKADMSLNDQLQVVARAVYSTAVAPMDGYCCIEETFDTYVIIEVCQSGDVETYWRADYTMDDAGAVTLAARDAWVQVEEVWQPVSNVAKASGLPEGLEAPDIAATMKAASDRQIDVKIAFGGPRSKDNHGEYFSARTDLAEADFPNPPLLYYHGFEQRSNKAMRKPVVIGLPLKRWSDNDAHYIRYQLKANQYANQTWDDACKGEIPASPGTIGYLIRKAGDGELLYWPIAEVSAWDRAGGRKQAYRHTVATAALKAAYIDAGLDVPALLDQTPPETPGDGVSAVLDTPPDVTPEQAAQYIVTQVASAVLAKQRIL